MATFVPISYAYVPTASRPASTKARCKPASKQSGILEKNQRTKPSNTAFSTPRLLLAAAAAAAADEGRHDTPGVREIGTLYGGSGRENDAYDGDNCDLPTIEELLFTKLQEEDLTTGDAGPERIVQGVEEVPVEEKGGFIDHSSLASGDDAGGSPDNPIVLLEDDDSGAPEAETDHSLLRADSTAPDVGHFKSLETAVASPTPAPPSSFDQWHDIDDFLETAQRLQLDKQDYSTSEATPSSPARFRSPALCQSRESPENQLGQEDQHGISPSTAEQRDLDDPTLTTVSSDEGRQLLEVEQEEDEANEKNDGLQQEVNDVVLDVIAERVTDTCASGEEHGSPRATKRQRLLSSCDLFPKIGQDEADGSSDNDSDDELISNKFDLNDDNMGSGSTKPKPKRPFSSYVQTFNERKHHVQHRSAPKRRALSHHHRYSPKPRSLAQKGPRVTAISDAEDQLPSPEPSATETIGAELSYDCHNLSGPSGDFQPILTEITFRPHSLHCRSFTAVIRDSCDRQGVSFSQLAQLIEDIGHIGEIDDFTIRSHPQSSFLVTGLSRCNLSRISSVGTAVSTPAHAGSIYDHMTRNRLQAGKANYTKALVSAGQQMSSDDDGGLCDSDLDPSSEMTQVRTSREVHARGRTYHGKL